MNQAKLDELNQHTSKFLAPIITKPWVDGRLYFTGWKPTPLSGGQMDPGPLVIDWEAPLCAQFVFHPGTGNRGWYQNIAVPDGNWKAYRAALLLALPKILLLIENADEDVEGGEESYWKESNAS